MLEKQKNPKDHRLIHIRIDGSLHKRLRVHVAEQDTSIQEWVANLIKIELNRINGRKDSK